jgi:hypothetical protein
VGAATLVSILYGDNFKVVSEALSQEQYVLVQCGTPEPTDAEVDAIAPLPTDHQRKRFTIPLEQVATESTVQLSYLQELGLEDRVRFVAGYAVGACWQKAKGCDGTYAGAYGDADVLASQNQQVAAVLADCFPPCLATDDLDSIYVSASQDVGPLHTAEHVKFLAAFFNKEAEANAMFTSTVQAYNDLMVTPDDSSPKVAWITKNEQSQWQEENFVLSLATYKTGYVTDGGGRNVDEASASAAAGDLLRVTDAVAGNAAAGKTLTIQVSDFEDAPAAAAAFAAMLADVDIIIDETYAFIPGDYNMESFRTAFGIASDSTLPAVAGNKVFRLDGRISEELTVGGYGLDWFESRLAHPQWVLQDLALALRGDGQSFHFFRNIAAGETPTIVQVSECTTNLPVCDDVSAPADIPVLFELTDSGSGSSSDSEAWRLAPFAVVIQTILSLVVQASF